jgi:hypothetical protein
MASDHAIWIFIPTAPFVFVSLERPEQLYVYGLAADGTLRRDPLFMKEALADPNDSRRSGGTERSHVHPNGASSIKPTATRTLSTSRARKVLPAARNNMAVCRHNEGPASRR